jgi:PAS domain S-box-containing protein
VLRRLRVGIGLALLYVLAAKLGLAFAFLHPSASPVWPPTGLALAALLMLGLRAWPAIFAGAFVANLITAGSLATSLGIALGNALEALLGARLITRFAGGAAAFERAPDTFKFFALGGLLAPVVSATLGVTSLGLGGFVPWADARAVWVTWWLGDAAGALIVAPVLLLWSRSRAPASLGRRPLEALGLLGAALAIGLGVFGGILPMGLQHLPVAFLCIPPLLWAAFRFGPREAATLVTVLTAIAVAGTLRGTGPFALASPNGSLLLLQAFMATLAVTVLPLAALAGQLRGALAEKDRLLGECTQAEAALRDSEARLYGLVQAAMDAIISVDGDQRIVLFNRAAEQLFRCRAADVLGQPLDRFIPPRAREAHRRHVEEFGRRGVTARTMGALGELTGLRADGEEFPIEASISQTAVGGQKRFTVILRDIAERKQAEEALRASGTRLSADLDAMGKLQQLGTLFVREGKLEPILGDIVEAAVALSVADFGNIQLLDAHSGDLRIAAQRGFPPWWIDFWSRVAAGQGTCGTALTRGERIIVEDVEQSPIFVGTPALAIQRRAGVRAVQSTPLVSRSGKPLGMFSTHYRAPHRPDERTLRLLDLLARQAADIIERAQGEEDLRTTLAEKEAALATNQALLREVHHRTKNNLQLLADLLYLKAERVAHPEGRVAFEEASTRIFALARLHEQLFLSMDHGRVQLGSYVRGIVEGLRQLERDARLRVEIPDAPVYLDLDRTVHTGLIVNELVTNALTHAFPEGTGEICVRLQARGVAVQLEVRDSGRGLPADFRLDEVQTLGLRIVHALAQRLHASVTVDSRDGVHFTLAFPMEADAPVEP